MIALFSHLFRYNLRFSVISSFIIPNIFQRFPCEERSEDQLEDARKREAIIFSRKKEKYSICPTFLTLFSSHFNSEDAIFERYLLKNIARFS